MSVIECEICGGELEIETEIDDGTKFFCRKHSIEDVREYTEKQQGDGSSG